MAKKIVETYTVPVCPSCIDRMKAAEKREIPPGADRQCIWCGQHLTEGRFFAHGLEAIEHQVNIVNYYNKIQVIRSAIGYSASALFVVVGAVLIVVAPDNRTMAANIIAGALLTLAAGIAGFTRIRARIPGLRLDAGKASN